MKVCIFLIITMLEGSASDIFNDIESEVLVALVRTIDVLCRLYEKYILRVDDFIWNTKELADDEYDFIIIGAGSSGCALANRLSEISKWKILLLEAGEPETSLLDIPLLALGFQGGKYDWSYLTEKQPNTSLGLIDQQMAIPRGKGLGGSSILNFMIYSRGTKADYDKWAELGNEGWSYDDVLPYFLKSEGAQNLSKADWKFHNKSGPLSVDNTYQSLLVRSVVSAGEDIGYSYVDYNSPLTPLGFSPAQSTLSNGKRFSAARAYLQPIANDRQNLDITVSALATKLLIEQETKKAYGVEYEKDGQTYRVRARKEVILSAGAINTPQLLMLAGIGPKEHLEELGIPCIQNLPVGKHLIDHLFFAGVVFRIYFDIDQTTLRYIMSAPEIIKEGKGPLATLGGVEGVAFLKLNQSKYEEDVPDIETLFIRGHFGSDHGNWVKPAFRIRDELYDNTFAPLERKPCWSIAPVLLHQESEGIVKLKSTDPHDPPLIYANYFTDEGNNDIKNFIAGIRIIEKLQETRAFRSNGAKLSKIPIHGCQHHEFDSDAYWECGLRTMSNTLYHQMGTCKMGPKEDPTAVVDSRLRVHGMKSLRVVDASIIPFTSGHTNAPCIMFGEKASDMIKEDYGEL